MMDWKHCHFWRPLMEGDDGAGNGGGTPPEAPISLDDHLRDNPESQKELDRRITKALETARGKWEKEAADRETEAAKLAKMTAEQKAEHERQKREEALTKREAELNRRELRATAAQTLAEKGLPAGLLECLSYQDAESCQKSIENMENAFRAAVQQGVEERIKGKPPTGTAPAEKAQDASLRSAFGLK